MANKIKKIWQAGDAVLNGWLNIPNGFSAEVMAQTGYDSITVDLQHGVQDYLSMVTCFQAMQAHPVVPLVRVPWNEPGIIGKAMDAGAYGVICPMVNTAQEAKNFISYCKYPPLGSRSNGPVRVGFYDTSGYQLTANEEVLCMPMIETAEALTNLEAILDTPGIDAVYIGPSDLAFSMGFKPFIDREEPEILAAYDRVLKEASKRGIHVGVHCLTAAYAIRMVAMGFKLVTINWDSGFINAGARAVIAQMRAAKA